jgi:hypothetical protein
MPELLRFSGSLERDPAIARWLEQQPGDLRWFSERWFAFMRNSGADVRELMHDGLATVCVDDAPFAYVGAFTAHVSVGFFHGAALPDPAALLAGTGKHMRHVKITPGGTFDAAALEALILAAHRDIVARLTAH